MAQFTGDDEGKSVIDPVDEEVGIVKTVEDGVAYVDVHPDFIDRIEADIGRGDEPSIDDYPIEDAHVGEITDDAIRLNQDLVTDRAGS